VPNASRASRRAVQPRLKLVIRRLPPGLTQTEFETAIGSEWTVGKGRVDWLDYHQGKISKDQGKPSRPATVYLHLTDSAHLTTLADQIREVQFQDAKNSQRDPTLIGPPTVEFALNPKVPQNRNRKDPRQSTIDQDPEFIAFLESLTNPIQKASMDLESSLQKDEKVTTTPLIEHLREKKAAKERPSKSGGKESREQRRKRKKEGASASTDKVGRHTKADAASKDGVKVLSRQVSAAASSNADKRAASPAASSTTSERRRERGPMNIAAKIQRDLGLGPAAPRRGARNQKATDAASSSSAVPTSAKEATASSSTSAAASTRPEARKGRDRRQKAESSKADAASDAKPVTLPVILKKQPEASSATTSTAPQSPTATHSTINPPAASVSKRAFLKHANPSQGITEPLLEAALTRFGTILKVEIDRKKGTAWAEFEDAAGLAAAIKAGKIEVGNGAVQVSNFRERAPQAGGAGRAAGPKAPAQGGQPQQQAGSATGGRSRGGRTRAKPRGGGGTGGDSASGAKDANPTAPTSAAASK
jgi:regulator of nonsense transcripts 3